MAVTEATPNFTVQIVVGGVALEEFDDEDEQTEPNTVTKYIESVSGAEFAIKYVLRKPWPNYTVMFEIYLDNKSVMSGLSTSSFQGIVDGTASRKNGQWTKRKFCFSELKVGTLQRSGFSIFSLLTQETDDSGVSSISDQLLQDLKGIGSITLKAYRVTNVERVSVHDSKHKDFTILSEVPEKAMKGRALSHQSSLKPPVPITMTDSLWKHDFVDGEKRPFAVFNFKYRSRAALKSLLIIPRSPSPVPLESRDIDTLTLSESRSLIRRLRERDAAARLVKCETVKREGSRVRSAMVKVADDDDDGEVLFVEAKRRRR